jgi:hypothetical protein
MNRKPPVKFVVGGITEQIKKLTVHKADNKIETGIGIGNYYKQRAFFFFDFLFGCFNSFAVRA